VHESDHEPTFGHRYLDISFKIAQSAFLCFSFETRCSEGTTSVAGAAFGLAFLGLCIVSGRRLSGESALIWTGTGTVLPGGLSSCLLQMVKASVRAEKTLADGRVLIKNVEVGNWWSRRVDRGPARIVNLRLVRWGYHCLFPTPLLSISYVR